MGDISKIERDKAIYKLKNKKIEINIKKSNKISNNKWCWIFWSIFFNEKGNKDEKKLVITLTFLEKTKEMSGILKILIYIFMIPITFVLDLLRVFFRSDMK